MNIANLFSDSEISDGEMRPTSLSLRISGPKGKLLSLLYLPGGAGPHPAVVLCHGYPGCEQNLDLAQALRRVGFAVMTFHYAGSWNSEGDFSIVGCLDDANAVLNAMLDNAEQWNIDTNKIFAVGHSMGGMVSAHLLAERVEIRAGVLIAPWDVGRTALLSSEDPACEKNLREVISCGFGWLRGVSCEKFGHELEKYASALCIQFLAPMLAKKPILCISASEDNDTPNALHTEPLNEAMKQIGAEKFDYLSLPTDHSFSDRRITLCKTVAEYLLNFV